MKKLLLILVISGITYSAEYETIFRFKRYKVHEFENTTNIDALNASCAYTGYTVKGKKEIHCSITGGAIIKNGDICKLLPAYFVDRVEGVSSNNNNYYIYTITFAGKKVLFQKNLLSSNKIDYEIDPEKGIITHYLGDMIFTYDKTSVDIECKRFVAE
jgi:hypothetical protein